MDEQTPAPEPVQFMRLKLSGSTPTHDTFLRGSQMALTDMDTGRLLLFNDMQLVMDDTKSFVWAQFRVPLTEIDLEGIRVAATQVGKAIS